MTTFTPFYDHEDVVARYFDAMKLHDALDGMPPLPWNQHATNSKANHAIVRRHRALVKLAADLRWELSNLARETDPLNREAKI